ncbi:hypothetical protein D917_09274, partial [Trichinella nativa]
MTFCRSAIGSAQPEFHELCIRDFVEDSADPDERQWAGLPNETQGGGE